MKRLSLASACTLAAGLLVSPAAGHELDHPSPQFAPSAPLASTFNSGGPGAKWQLVTTIPTGNPHTDIDFFTHDGETYVSAGTLAAGPNAGGQTIVKLTQDGEVDPTFVSAHPSASCLSNPSAALGLQHDVEATPKGGALLNALNPFADPRDAQLIVDASDQRGRCHDQGELGLAGAPRGGLELVDVTDPAAPKEIGLSSHTGEAHTVNVDPKRPHIAYAVTSDAIAVDSEGKRANEDPASGDRFDLDGFEVVDMSSCMNFPPGTTLQQRRDACRPEVYRYRYPTTEMALGHTLKNAVYGCHELEVYPNDRLACGSGQAAMLFDMSGAFDDRGTPADFSDDKPRGRPLPCHVRDSSSVGEFGTGAKVTDCVTGEQGGQAVDLTIPGWLAIGAPSLEGVQWLGTAHHQGRGAGNAVAPAFDSTQDVDFDHEAELTQSGRFLLATDERGGGVTPPGATCTPVGDNKAGNGGIHAYAVDRLTTAFPSSPDQAFQAYARTPSGAKAIYRAKPRTKVEPTVCTAHVFQQIPGQNRIFMGWYSQGTQVVDFEEHPDGTIEFREAGWFIPENANTWVSHVFKHRDNGDGTFTYWGATGDFNIGSAGRNAIDVWKVTLPAPPLPAGTGILPAAARRGAGGGQAGVLAASEAHRCLSGRARVGSRGIGRIRIGQQRARVIRRAGPPTSQRGLSAAWCVRGGGAVRAAFSRRGDLRLVATTARSHRSRSVRSGVSTRFMRRVYRGAARAGRGLFFTHRSSRIVFGTSRGRVRFVAVVDRRLVKNRRLLSLYLRRAGVR
jgi:hypothetical protein